ncbi:Protoporphyrinogen oxidase [Sporormia fimetaria CBS 119925]|uniref:Protoporphyrinogen oxidase n=1 Tax=Sporormia fimetaria CBS 119925 TaxID=1340428 RepID=A0A6A6VB50_9PLEO|nr:Protoporphyrinogen oxidase [Sporormia fimetaria CBS 119925]
MRFNRHVFHLDSALRHHISPSSSLSRQCRRYASDAQTSYPKRIAIVGGGIAGLSAAHFINREFPKSQITLYEAQDDVGGWIQSRKVQVDGGEVIFEYGPHTLRPAGPMSLPSLMLIKDVGVADQLVGTAMSSEGAGRRFLYYPDRLNELPSGRDDLTLAKLLKLQQAGLLSGIASVLKEPFVPPPPDDMIDDSVGEFLSRRFDKRLVDNLASAVYHGIYAGDIYQLSAAAMMPAFWRLERDYKSILGGLWKLGGKIPIHPHQSITLHQILEEAHERSYVEEDFNKLPQMPEDLAFVYFKGGIQTLVNAIEKSLRSKENVTIKTGTAVHSYENVKDKFGRINVVAGESSSEPVPYDFVVSTTPMNLTPYATVMVVNLYYQTPNLAPAGFGYLIPQSVPMDQNPEYGLGVIFDSHATPHVDEVPGTKLTVMMGGHWWQDWASYPSESEGAAMAKSMLKRHLSIDVEPDACHVTLNRDCIPQYTVGYVQRADELDADLRHNYKGRVRVVGSQFNGVGVNDVIRGAFGMAKQMKVGGLFKDGWRDTHRTGLERWTFDQSFDPGFVLGRTERH